MSQENPIVAFEHVPNNDWGAGVVPIWKNGNVGFAQWTKMAVLYGIQKALIPDP